MLETYTLSTRGVLPAYRFGSNLVANDQASAGFHAAFGIVGQLVLPRVYLSWANVEAWFLFAFLAEVSVYDDEGFGVFAEAN